VNPDMSARCVVVRCTKKRLDLLGDRKLMLSELPPSDEDWYLNLVWIERQKCLLLTHNGTLFTVLRTGIHVADLATRRLPRRRDPGRAARERASRERVR
jgi:hypothetical protein